jgi:catalase
MPIAIAWEPITIKSRSTYRESPLPLDRKPADAYDRNQNDDDHFTQPGLLFRKVMTEKEQINTVGNIVDAMNGISGPKRDEIIQRQLGHFHQADPDLAILIAKGLNVKI